jgi:hypothetical protein
MRLLYPISALALVLLTGAGRACNVPVFRYALEKWKPDVYEVLVFHRGDFSKEGSAIIKELKSHGPGEDVPANLDLTLVNLDGEPEAEHGKLYASLGKPALPCMVVRTKDLDREMVTVWSGKLASKAVANLLQSPIRKEMVKRIATGETAVWVLLESGDKEKDDTAAALLEKELKRLTPGLKLPKLTDQPEDKLAGGGPPLKVAFSVLRLRRDDAAEEALRLMLLKSESDIEKRREPMVFPIFGRGRCIGGLIGKGITAENIKEGCSLLVAPCSCKFKVQSPGFDLLISTDWEAMFQKK